MKLCRIGKIGKEKPAVLDKEAHKIFEMKKKDKIYFMEKAVKVRSLWKKKIPAVTHVDYSARVQTVTKNTNNRYYDLISKFKEKTGCPVIVNTSFNVRGEPIVCDVNDAYRCFMGTDLDILVCENYILYKENQNKN